ncbi:MAG: ACP S-malonyltransferase [Gammaproteobacteria bacterium]|nr:ACP S-malonyltransferase [Gammaproteobacteria bacterium]NNF67064.1 ACP S-malonyltransferase [Gammaproteobacteria bacterium]
MSSAPGSLAPESLPPASLAFVFPGQGSQSVGMLSDLAEHDQVAKTFSTASAVLQYDLWERVQHGPADRLNVTECTQPAMLTVGVAMWRLWQEQGGSRPAVMAGHSLGEYTALVCSGALDFETAVALVQFRGRIMQEAVPGGSGAMAAVLGLDDDQVIAVCAEISSEDAIVEAVNFNAPGQVVIAGHRSGVETALQAMKSAGARRAIELPVSVPSHSSLMRPAAEKLVARLAETDFQMPDNIDVYTVGVIKHQSVAGIREALGKQLYMPVRWSETMQKVIHDDGARHIVECGPGKVLTGLNRRIERDREIKMQGIFDTESLSDALQQAE